MAMTFKASNQLMVANENRSKKTQSLNFDIFSAFERLETGRKLALCDQLYHSGGIAFKNMVEKLWPNATEIDSSKLENLLRSRINRIFQQ